MDRLIRKLRFMRMAVSEAIGHVYTMHIALTRTQVSKNAMANLPTQFHRDIKFWRNLCVERTTRPTYLVKIVYRDVSNLFYTNTSVKVAGWVCIEPNKDGTSVVWQVKWPADIIRHLVSFSNPGGTITN